MEHRLVVGIAEVHVAKAHVAPQLHQGAVGPLPGPVAGAAVRLGEVFAVLFHPHQHGAALVGFRLGVHDGEDAFGAGHGGQQHVDLLADLGHRLGDLTHVHQVGAHGAHVEDAPQSQQAADAAGGGVVDAAQVAHSGHHGAGVGLGAGGGVPIGGVEGGELLHGLALVVEDLDDLLALDHLLDVAVEGSERCLLLLEIGAAAAAHELDHEAHHQQEEHGDERQPPVEHEHHDQCAEEGQHAG